MISMLELRSKNPTNAVLLQCALVGVMLDVVAHLSLAIKSLKILPESNLERYQTIKQ